MPLDGDFLYGRLIRSSVDILPECEPVIYSSTQKDYDQMKQDIARDLAEKLVTLLDQKYGERIDEAFLSDLKRMFEFE